MVQELRHGDEAIVFDPEERERAAAAAAKTAHIRKPPFGMRAPTFPTPSPTAGEMAGPTELPSLNVQSSGRTVVVAAVLTGVWLVAFAIYITTTIGWNALFTLLPDQFGSFMATFILPIAFIWVVIAFLDRGREFQFVLDVPKRRKD